MNNSNLNPVRTVSEAREKGRAGGIASGEARRKKRDLMECLIAILDGKDSEGLTGAEKLATTLFKSALDGNIRAISLLHDIVYGKPVSSIEMTGKNGTPLNPPPKPEKITITFIDPKDGKEKPVGW